MSSRRYQGADTLLCEATVPVPGATALSSATACGAVPLTAGRTYYWMVRAVGCNQHMTTRYSDGVVIDTTPPDLAAVAVHDGPGPTDIDLQDAWTRTLSANWPGFRTQACLRGNVGAPGARGKVSPLFPPSSCDGDTASGLCMGLLFVGSHVGHHNMFPAHSIVHYTRSMGSFVLRDRGLMRESCLGVKHRDRWPQH